MTESSRTGFSPGLRVVLGLIVLALLMIAVGAASNAEDLSVPDRAADDNRSGGVEAAPGDPVAGSAGTSGAQTERDPVQIPNWVAGIVAGVSVLAALRVLSLQRFVVRRRRARVRIAEHDVIMSDEERDEAVATMATDLIEELRLGADPRAAIQAAYAAVETGFGVNELARGAAETPNRYLERIFGRDPLAAEPLDQLTALFQIARFSDEPVDENMRSNAIEALAEIRDRYRRRAFGRTALPTT